MCVCCVCVFGDRVKLAVHKETSECVAVKIVQVLEEGVEGYSGLTKECLKKEVSGASC